MITCSSCKQEKNESAFQPSQVYRCGNRGRCRECAAAYRASFRLKNPEKVRAKRKAAYQKHRIAELSRAKTWNKHNSSKYYRNNAAWREANADAIKQYTDSRKYEQARSGAIRRGKEWKLTKEEHAMLTENAVCYYCSGALPRAGLGLDRLNNALGYEKSNCVPCCTDCNKTRGNRLTPEEMLEVAKLLNRMRNK